MSVSLEEMEKRLGVTPERKAKIDQRAQHLIQEHQTLQQLRKARRFTQERMAELLGVEQNGISRLERRSDMLLSTMRSYVEALGGQLQLVASFPDAEPMAIELGDLISPRRKKGRIAAVPS